MTEPVSTLTFTESKYANGEPWISVASGDDRVVLTGAEAIKLGLTLERLRKAARQIQAGAT